MRLVSRVRFGVTVLQHQSPHAARHRAVPNARGKCCSAPQIILKTDNSNDRLFDVDRLFGRYGLTAIHPSDRIFRYDPWILSFFCFFRFLVNLLKEIMILNFLFCLRFFGGQQKILLIKKNPMVGAKDPILWLCGCRANNLNNRSTPNCR